MNELTLREEAKRHILRTKQIVKEFPQYPKAFLNKLICFRYNLMDHVSKQIRDYCNFEKRNPLRKEEKFDIIIDK